MTVTTMRPDKRLAWVAVTILAVLAGVLGMSVPSHAVLPFDNARMADIALSYVGQPGVNACRNAGQGDAYAGQCKQFVNCIVVLAGGPMPGGGDDYAGSFVRAGGTEISEAEAVKGDIIQWGSGITRSQHTAIVVTNFGGGRFDVVDSNWGTPGLMVKHHTINNIHADIFNGAGAQPTRFIRMGTVNAGSPFGYLDEASSPAPGVLRVGGWAADPSAPTTSIDVHVYANSIGFNLGPARSPREDVGRAYPGYGNNHGYASDLALEVGGSYRVCAFGINVGPGSNQPLRDCKQVTIADPRPFGYLDKVSSPAPGKVVVSGWAVDPNQPTAPIDVHVYVGNAGYNIGKASARRDDVGKALPAYGPNHGYNATLTVPAGKHRVCAFGINSGPGNNQPLKDCKDVVVAAPPLAPPKTTNPAPVPPAAPATTPTVADQPKARARVKAVRVNYAGGNRVVIKWKKVPRANAYRIKLGRASGKLSRKLRTKKPRISVSIKSNGRYRIKVSAMGPRGNLARTTKVFRVRR